jgi:cytochrome c2
MNRLKASMGLFMAGIVLIAATVAVSYESHGQTMDGKALVAERCATCHSLDRIERRFGQDLSFWESTVDRMLGKRNMLNDAERVVVLNYLIAP